MFNSQASESNEKSAVENGQEFKLPATLLTEPLPPQQVARLSLREKKIYNI